MPKLIVKTSTKILLIVLLLVLTLMAAKGAFGAVGKKHTDGIGILMLQDNPNMYLAGRVIDVSPVGDGVNLRFQPRGTYGLFSESVLLCDIRDAVEQFHDKGDVVVLTYERQAHRTIEGVGCHDLKFVDKISGGSNETIN